MNDNIWSKEEPTELGYYWVKFDDGAHEILKLVDSPYGKHWQIHGVSLGTHLLGIVEIAQWSQRLELPIGGAK